MNCFRHPTTATGVCVYCGRALCPACSPTSPEIRLTCSAECAARMTRQERLLAGLMQRSTQGARLNAVFYLLCGLLSLGGAVAAHFYLPAPFLIWFCAGCAVIFLGSGAWQWFTAR
ncbi:MAG TPA: hypothetical protein VF607_00520, partial [Verrucomicrobiae bacterium]